MQLQAEYKKPENVQVMLTKARDISAALEKVKMKDFKAPKYHMELLCNTCGIFSTFLLENNDDAKEYFKEQHNSLPFPGNRIRKLEKELDSAWVDCYLDLC